MGAREGGRDVPLVVVGGNYCGVCDDRGRAMRYAQAHLSAGQTGLVESARLTLGIGGPIHIRAGQRFTARLVCGRARWAEGTGAEAS